MCKQRRDSLPALDNRSCVAALSQWFDINDLIARAVDNKLRREWVEGRIRAYLRSLAEEFFVLAYPRREDRVLWPKILDRGHGILVLLLLHSLGFGLLSH